tara:strand:+ start:199 stop:984 length:786 start_codon:yes stop_codon:yes gene_type:complete
MTVQNLDEQISSIFKKFKIQEIKCLFIANDLGKIGLRFGISKLNKKELLEIIYSNLIKINKDLTIVVPTASLNMVNSGEIFDLQETPSYKMGSFSEFIRKKRFSKRSYHPFWSLTALGPLASSIVDDVSDNAYDENSAFGKLFKLKNSFFLSIGNHPRFMLSIIHYFEYINKVPYRFTKKFNTKCLIDGKITAKNYKLYVLKKKFINKKRAFNKKIFENFEKNIIIQNSVLGNGKLYFFNLSEFYDVTQDLFKNDINCWWK